VFRTISPLLPVLVLPVLLLAPALRPGWVLSSGDAVFDWPALAGARPDGWREPGNSILHDPVLQFVAWRRFIVAELRAGRVPFWNPHALAGSPLLGNSQSAVFDPLSLPHLLGRDPARTTVWVALLRLWVAGIGAALLARRLGASGAGQAIAGLAYGCGGFMVLWLLFPHTSSAAWVPWVLLAAEHVAAGGGLRASATLGIVLALAAFGGHPEVAFFMGLAAPAWLVVRLLQFSARPREAAKSVLLVVAAGVLALALAAVHVLPFVEALRSGSMWADRSRVVRALEEAPRFKLEQLALQVFPYLLGRPLAGEVVVGPAFSNFCEQACSYVSLGGFALALVGVAAARRRHAAIALASVGGVFWLYSLWFAPFVAVALRVPLVGVALPDRAVPVASCCLAVLAGLGFDAAVADAARLMVRLSAWAAAFLAAAVVVAAAGTSILAPLLAGERGPLAKTVRPEVVVQRRVVGFGTGLTAWGPVWARRLGVPQAVIAAATAVGLGCLVRRRRGGRFVVAGVIGADLWFFGAGFNPALPAELSYPRTADLELLAQTVGSGRLVAVARVLPANLATWYGLDDVLGYDAIGRRRLEALLRLGGDFPSGPLHWPLVNYDLMRSPAHDVLAVATVAAPRALEGADLDLIGAGTNVFVYRNRNAHPRVWIPARVTVAQSEQQAAALLAGLFASDRDAVVVEGTGNQPPPAGVGSASLVRPAPGKILVDAVMERAGVVVVSEGYDPGWSARVDGQAVAVYPCDLALMAVEAPAGRNRIELTFRPRTWSLAVALSTAAALVVAVLLAIRKERDAQSAAVLEHDIVAVAQDDHPALGTNQRGLGDLDRVSPRVDDVLVDDRVRTGERSG